MPNFFIKKEDIKDTTVTITSDDAHHIARSLRMAVGDVITVSDNEGMQYSAKLTKIRDDVCEAEIEDKRSGFGEPPVSITLFMGYPKADKLELVVQKATELGASQIVPFESARCIKRPTQEKMDKINTRLCRIAAEAAKQCSRSKIPIVAPVIKFPELVRRINDFDLALFCYEGAPKESSCKKLLDSVNGEIRKIAVIVGSEGGFDSAEAAELTESGADAVSLGERILRCETAPDFILSAISYRFEM